MDKRYHSPKVLNYPPNNEVESLFEYCVIKHINLCNEYSERYDIKYNHQQWANRFFGYLENGNVQSEYMSLVKNEYKLYFSNGSAKYSFDMERIQEDFPWFFNEEFDEDNYSPIKMLGCIESELREARRYVNIQHYKVDKMQEISEGIYCLHLKLDENDSPKFHPSSRAQLKIEKTIGCVSYYGKIVEYDDDQDSVYVFFEQQIDGNSFGKRELIVDMTFILEGLKKRILDFIQNSDLNNNLPVMKIYTRNLIQKEVQLEKSIPFNATLDEAQRKAFIGALKHDISFIWGPPGTGKSYVLANIIRALYSQDERTLVCCISNVAVDQLLNKEIDLIDNENDLQPQSGDFFRSGKSLDERIQQTAYLYPDSAKMERFRRMLDELNKSIKEMEGKISKCNDNIKTARQQGNREREYNLKINRLPRLEKEKVELINSSLQLLDDIQDYIKGLVHNSKVVFSTIANAIIDEKLNDCEFDNLIIDEASMLSLPYFLAIAKNTKKRIIISGDFRQLGTVSLTPHYCLKKNIYDYCGITNSNYECVYPLLVQRRSVPEIVNLINDSFYDKILKTQGNAKESDKAIEVVNVPDGEVKYYGTTRYNDDNVGQIISILKKYRNSEIDDKTSTIGIIAPYKGQVAKIEDKIDFEFNKDNRTFFKRIKVGTIHKFQGSECDWIIYDMVDARKALERSDNNLANGIIGKLYKGKEGEQLVNVALSRARKRLTVVGDIICLSQRPQAIGTLVTNKVRGVFNKLYNMINP